LFDATPTKQLALSKLISALAKFREENGSAKALKIIYCSTNVRLCSDAEEAKRRPAIGIGINDLAFALPFLGILTQRRGFCASASQPLKLSANAVKLLLRRILRSRSLSDTWFAILFLKKYERKRPYSLRISNILLYIFSAYLFCLDTKKKEKKSRLIFLFKKILHKT